MAVLGAWRYRSTRAARRGALTQALLRAPGESLRLRMADANWDTAEYAALALFVLPLAAALLAPQWGAGERTPLPETALALAACAVALQGWLSWRLWRVLRRARNLALAYEAEVAAGHELDRLAPLGYRVFHDVPVEERGFSVNHVVIGPAGVFAVGTEGRARPRRGANGDGESEVAYDGETLRFPGWRESKPLKQAVAQADWVRAWLSTTVGETVPVRPLVVLPGWHVKRTAVTGIPVLAAQRIAHFFQRMAPEPKMSEALIQQLAQQLERRCRHALPAAAR
jgi:hypothetical protein